MSDQDHQELLHMHKFYSEEARHQRTMMWETVKWFTPILTLIVGVWIKYYIDEYLPCENVLIWLILLGLSIVGFFLSSCCVLLLRSFYKTNLKYITMLAKVEDELNFDSSKRSSRNYFSGDEYITWEGYRESRMGNEPNATFNDKKEADKYTSESHISRQLRDKRMPFKATSIFSLMKFVFYIFVVFFAGCILLLLINILT
jgi:hypothetical protein